MIKILQIASPLRSKLRTAIILGSALCAVSPNAALAEVKDKSERGFSILHIADVKATPSEIWSNVLLPNKWWSDDHSWSGDSDNFYLEPEVGGCFCEILTKEVDGESKQTGAVEHMRIIHINRDNVLRMNGALGPLQSEAVNGTLTIVVRENDDDTSKVGFSYNVGGYMRFNVDRISASIDRVIGEQFSNLIKLSGPIIEKDKIELSEKAEETGEEVIDGTSDEVEPVAQDEDTRKER